MGKKLSGMIKLIRFLKDKDVPFSRKLLFLVPILYLIFPFDIIGDFFPLAGQLDDIAVIVVMWPILKNLISNYSSFPSSNKFDGDDNKTININRDDYDVEWKSHIWN